MFNRKSTGYLEWKRNPLTKKIMFLGLFLFALPVAATQAPSQDFWDYIQDFSDDNGDVLDPLEYDQLLSMKDNEVSQSGSQSDELDTSVDAQKVRHADMKIGIHSSAQASSSMKGEKL